MTQGNKNPEQIARDAIDARLEASGWAVQDKRSIDFTAASGVAITEYTTSIGPADYVLFTDKKAVGVVEAKKDFLGLEHHDRGGAVLRLRGSGAEVGQVTPSR